MYTSDMKNVMNLAAEAKLPVVGRLCFLPLFANVIKNNITRSVIYIYIYI